MQKTALILGITGQVGSYLSELLIRENVKVIGLVRRTSVSNTSRIDHIKDQLILEDGDITDAHSINRVVDKYKPDYCFNLAAQSFVQTSFNQPDLTFQVNTLGTLNILQAIKNLSPHTRFLQSNTSEMYGSNFDTKIEETHPLIETGVDGLYGVDTSITNRNKKAYQDENTEFRPESPYAISKVAAHQLIQLYRKAYNLFAVSAISFNHESPRRGDEFVTKKIINYVKKLRYVSGDNLQYEERLKLGNINSSRDWSHTKDIVEGYWLAINYKEPDDYVFSSQETHTVREFLDLTFASEGLLWEDYVEISQEFMRPSEVDYLNGISEKARKVLGWKPKYKFNTLIKDMLEN